MRVGPPNAPGGGAAAALEVRNLRASYGSDEVLHGVDLSVRTGEIVALLGPSGCGKTTLLRCVAGFLVPTDGSIRIHDRAVFGPGCFREPQARRVGLVPQEGALFPHLDVGANVAFGLKGLDRPSRARRVAESLELVGLSGWERRRPSELSGGQQQRVALARALAPSPGLVLLDEPFSALDAGLRQQLRDDVRNVLGRAGVAAVLVTHDQSEALSFAERVAVMHDGRILQVADPVTLYRHPADPVVGEFVGESTLLPGRMRGGSVQTELGMLSADLDGGGVDGPGAAAAPEVQVLVRPEQVRLDAAEATVSAEVVSTQYFGHDGLVHLALPSGTRLLARIDRQRLPARGTTVRLGVEGSVAVFREGARLRG